MSRESWHVPEQREPGVLYMHGQPGTDYAAVRAIEVDGVRFERVRKCVKRIPNDMEGYVFCSACGAEIGEYGVPNFCHNCGAKVVDADD